MYPVLYSFRRCPYAMRARLAIAAAQIAVELREIELRDKPDAMLSASPKGTVPVLQLENGEVIAESLDIMYWGLGRNDPLRWLEAGRLTQADALIQWNDGEFKVYLDRYKYADRYPERSASAYRREGERFLAALEQRLNKHPYLCGASFSLADAAILPFIRQFAAVDSIWLQTAPYPALREWLRQFLISRLFNAVMIKYKPWRPNDPRILFGVERQLV
ncbi:MAG: glutathione S-transferase [Methylomonas sp.]|jgi:glutathione S-transferase